jgi:hypothetical protein
MLTVDIQGSSYKLADDWSDITLKQFGELCSLPVPNKLRERWRAYIEDKEAPEDTHREIIKIYPSYYGKVIKILSDVPQKVIDCIEWSVRDKLFNEYLLKFAISTVSSFPQYDPVGARSFTLDGEEFFLPESLRGFPMTGEKIMTFSEASDIEIALNEWAEKGIDAMAQICAVYLRKKGEVHSDELVIQRTETFKELPMSVVWEVFFCIVILGWQLGEGIQIYSREVVQKLLKQHQNQVLEHSESEG